MNTTIDIIVDKVINREQLGDRQFPRLFDIALDGYKQIFRRALPNYKTLFLHWDDPVRRFIKYPQDYDKYMMVGVAVRMPSGNVSILTLSRNDYLCFDKPLDCVCDCENNETVTRGVDRTMAVMQDGFTPFNNMYSYGAGFRDGQYIGELYGFGGGQSYMGSFTEDPTNQRFVFGADVPTDTQIVLRYRPAAVTYDGQSVTGVPDMAEEALIAWVQWKRLNQINSSINERDAAEYRYNEELNRLNIYMNAMEDSEIMDLVFEGLTFSISR